MADKTDNVVQMEGLLCLAPFRECHIFSTAMVPVVNKTTEGSSYLATAVRLET
jgi:hypothetical protein